MLFRIGATHDREDAERAKEEAAEREAERINQMRELALRQAEENTQAVVFIYLTPWLAATNVGLLLLVVWAIGS